mgnify:FL=1
MEVVGRSVSGCEAFRGDTGVVATPGGIDAYLAGLGAEVPHEAIVAVDPDALYACTLSLLRAGVRRILVEKPGGLGLDELEHLARVADEQGAEVRVAYNRRYLQSVQQLRQHAQRDGGITSVHFEFTEWAHVIEKLDHSVETLSRWLLANSSHVIDTAFYLAGEPTEDISCFQSQPIKWHEYGCFTGAGSTNRGALFSYLANWGSAGRWSLEAMTARGRYKLCPMETLRFQPRGELTEETLGAGSDIDVRFKPGLYRMVEDFIGDVSELPTVRQQLEMARVYFRMAGYAEASARTS